MKKPVQKILLLIFALYLLTAYTDFKKGFLEGFMQKNCKPINSTINTITKGNLDDLKLPLIIKIY
jgi:hypothetical protein